MLDAIRNFFAATLNDEPPCEAKLSAQLDALAVAYHATPNGEPVDDDQRPPASEYYATRDRVRARFPELGCFSVADPMNPSRDGWMECSASDALADIIGDLEKVLWRLETFGEEDARWHFRMLYEIHWGRHLRELQLYLFARLVARLSD